MSKSGLYRKQKPPEPGAISKRERKQIQFIRRQLINSKGNTCALCNKPIDDMKDCTVDHIIPISKGGLTTIENCQLAHSTCNVKKGNKL
jgi:5-methylcytosine-specific restriction endonuclease McrA